MAALDEQVKRNELFDVTEVMMLCCGAYSVARNRILGIHNKVASEYSDLDTNIVERIKELSIEALNQIGDDGVPPDLAQKVRPEVMRVMKNYAGQS